MKYIGTYCHTSLNVRMTLWQDTINRFLSAGAGAGDISDSYIYDYIDTIGTIIV